MKLRAIEPLPKLRRRPQYLPMPKHDASRTEWLRWRHGASGVEEKCDAHNVDEDLADYAAQGSPTWLGALLVISLFLAGGLTWALVERWWLS